MSRRETRLLMTADAVGGVWQYATELAAALVPHGVRTTLAVLGPSPEPDQYAMAEAIAGLRLIDTGLPLDWLSDGPGPVLAAGGEIADLARATGADIVQLNMPTLAAGGHFDVPVVAVAHGCLATWWEAAWGTPLPADYRWHRAMMRRGLAAADCVVAPSAAFAATVARTYTLAALPVVVHNGRALPPEATGTPIDAAVTAGRLWDAAKNARTLDAAAAEIAIPLRAAGAVTGPHGETIAFAHLELLGRLDGAALARTLAARPIYVSAARFEPFGLAVLEAAGAGCALVLSDIPTFRELWDGAARFVAADDAAGFAGAIDALHANPEDRAALGAAARARAARYTPAATAAAMAARYAALGASGRAAA